MTTEAKRTSLGTKELATLRSETPLRIIRNRSSSTTTHRRVHISRESLSSIEEVAARRRKALAAHVVHVVVDRPWPSLREMIVCKRQFKKTRLSLVIQSSEVSGMTPKDFSTKFYERYWRGRRPIWDSVLFRMNAEEAEPYRFMLSRLAWDLEIVVEPVEKEDVKTVLSSC